MVDEFGAAETQVVALAELGLNALLESVAVVERAVGGAEVFVDRSLVAHNDLAVAARDVTVFISLGEVDLCGTVSV